MPLLLGVWPCLGSVAGRGSRLARASAEVYPLTEDTPRIFRDKDPIDIRKRLPYVVASAAKLAVK